MKKRLLFFSLFLVTLTVVSQVEFGFKAGLNLTDIVGEDTELYTYRTGWSVGGFVNIEMSQGYSFQPEINYSEQNSVFPTVILENFSTRQIDVIQRQRYLQIPLMVRLSIFKGLELEAGPQVGFLMNAEGVLKDESSEFSDSISEFISPIDVSVNTGILYHFDTGTQIGTRAIFGLSNINDEDRLREAQDNALLEVFNQRNFTVNFYLAQSF